MRLPADPTDELVYRSRLRPSPAVILLRFPPVSPGQVAARVAAALGERSDGDGHSGGSMRSDP